MFTPVRALAVAILLSALTLPTIAVAAPQTPTHSVLSRFSPTLMHTPAAATLSTLMHRSRPNIRAAAPLTVTSPEGLSVPFPANAIDPAKDAVDVTFLDNTSSNPYGQLTPGTYASAGAKGGYVEFSRLPLSSNTDTIEILYVGTYYDTAARAAARATATANALTSKGLKDLACGPTCHLFFLVTGTNPTDSVLAYSVFSSGNAVGEMSVSFTNDQFTKEKSTVAQAVVAGLPGVYALFGQNSDTGATGSDTTPTVTIAGAAMGHKVKGKIVATKALKSKEQGTFIVYVQFGNGDKSTQSASITFAGKGLKPLTKDLKNVGVQSNGSVAFGTLQKFNVTKTVKVTAHITAKNGSAEAKNSFTFNVKLK